MKLYVANCSKQTHMFTYRVAEMNRIKTQEIAMGSQIVVWKEDATREVLEAILAQYEIYGIVDVKSLDQTREFVGLCYSWDKPIPVEKIMRTNLHNDNVLDIHALEARKNEAAALSNVMDQKAEGFPLRNLEVEVSEVLTRGQAEESAFRQTIRVEKQGQSLDKPTPSKRAARRRG